MRPLDDRSTAKMGLRRRGRRALSAAYNRVVHPRFHRLKRETDGMLEAAVYRRLHREIRRLPDLDFVDVGAAAGATTITIAWAMDEGGRSSRVIAVEKCEGGSRILFGDHEENRERLERNLLTHGVRDRVVVVPRPLDASVVGLVASGRISGFLHDADGRIDRDFEILWPLVEPGGLIVVDDAVDRAEFRPVSPRYPDGGTKCLVTHRLLKRFVEWGLFEPRGRTRTTSFGRKPHHDDFSRFDPRECARIVAEIEHERDAFLSRGDGS